MGPQNYILRGMADPGLAFSQGLQDGQQAVLQAQAQALALQQQRAAMEAAAQREAVIQEIVSAPRPTAAQYAKLMTLMPEKAEGFNKAWAALNTEQSQSRLSDLTQWTAAIEAGRPEVAVSAMIAQADALDAQAGKQTPEGQALRAQADIVKADPRLAARVVLGPLLAAHPDGGKVLDNITKRATEERTAATFPAELRTKEAGATKAEADAVTAGVTAKYAEPMAVADLKKKAADLGLTQAQTTQAITTTRKLNAEIQQAALQAATGDPKQRFELEKKLRDEFTTQGKEAILTQDAYQRITASRKDAIGDIALIFGYMKMLDPTSVVREGEFATAQSAAGVDERVRNLYNKLVEGKTVLPETQRQKILAQARDLSLKADEKLARVKAGLMPSVSAYKLDERNIFSVAPPTPAPPTPAPPKPGAPTSEPTATNPKTGERLVLRGGKWVPMK